MIQKKICLLGAFAVGKTSLINQYVNSIFSEKYLTTVGVKIDKKILTNGTHPLTLMIWDLAGEDDYSSLRPHYLRGLSGCIIVVDGTRKQSYQVAMSIYERVVHLMGAVPVVFAINKADIKTQWICAIECRHQLEQLGFPVIETSAKSGEGVEELFSRLSQHMVGAA